MPTFHVRDTRNGGDLLAFNDFDVVAAEPAEAVALAEARLRAWRGHIRRGAPAPEDAPGRWRYELREVPRPALHARTLRPGAPAMGNPIVVTVGVVEAGRLVQEEKRRLPDGPLVGHEAPEQPFRFAASEGSPLAALDGRAWLCTPACREPLAEMRRLLEAQGAG